MKINTLLNSGKTRLGNEQDSIIVSYRSVSIGLYQEDHSYMNFIQISDIDTLDRLISALQKARTIYTEE